MEQVEVTLKLKIACDSQELKKALVNEDGTVNIGFLADVYDIVGTELVPEISSINDLTQEDIRKKLNEAAGL